MLRRAWQGCFPPVIHTHLEGEGWAAGGWEGVGRVEALVGREAGSRSPQGGLAGGAVGGREAGALWDMLNGFLDGTEVGLIEYHLRNTSVRTRSVY